MTNETAKLIDIMRALHAYAPEKPLPEVLDTAMSLLGATSDKRRAPKAPRKPKAQPPEAA